MTAEPVMNFVDAEVDESQPSALVPYQSAQFNPWRGLGSSPLHPDIQKILLAPIDESKIKIRPDGLIYIPGVFWRRRLIEAFGVGGWGIFQWSITTAAIPDEDGNVASGRTLLYYDGSLIAHGSAIARACGEQEFYQSNKGMSHASAIEAAKTNCLERCCKDLGMFMELWDKDYADSWRAANAIEAWCETDKGRSKKMWRLKTDPPIDQFPWKEKGKGQGGGNSGKAQPSAKPPANPPKPQGVSAEEQNARVAIIKSIAALKGYLEKLSIVVPPKPSRMSGDLATLKTSTALTLDDFQEYDLALLDLLITEAKAMANYAANDDLFEMAASGSDPKAMFEKMMEIKAEEERDAL